MLSSRALLSRLTTALIAASCLNCFTPAYADTIFGVYLGAGLWQSNLDGNVSLTGEPIDLSDDLGFGREDNSYVYAAFEHPIPLIPNLRISQTQLKIDADNTLSRNITFNNQTYLVTEQLHSKIDLSFTDATFYYEVLDNWASLDLGITARNFDGSVEIENNGNNNRFDIGETLPLLYAAAEIELPFTGFSLQGELQGLSISDSSITDASIKLAYESAFGLGAELGYRLIDIQLDDLNDFNSDLQSKGAVLGLTYHF